MKKALGAAIAFGLMASLGAAHAQEMSFEARGALANANLAAKDRSGWYFWRIAFRGNTTLQAAFDTKYNMALRPEYLSGTHVDGSRVYLGMARDGALIGGVTPFGTDACSAQAINRKLLLSAYFGRTLKPIKLGPLERLQYTPEGSTGQSLCYYPFRLGPSEMDRNFVGLGDQDTMRLTVRVDDKVDHSVWTGAEYTPKESGTGRAPQALTQKQYKGLRAFLTFLPS